MEAEIKSWVSKLPTPFQFDLNIATNHEHATDPVLASQACELAILTHRLIVRIYLPFLRRATYLEHPPYQASYATVNAAHVIIHGSRALLGLWKAFEHHQSPKASSASVHPVLFGIYPLKRILFDAAIICGHAAIKEPMTVWARTAIEDVNVGYDCLMGDGIWKQPMGPGITPQEDLQPKAALEVLRALKKQIDSLSLGLVSSASGPLKRKHPEESEDYISPPSDSGFVAYPMSPSQMMPRSSQSARAPSIIFSEGNRFDSRSIASDGKEKKTGKKATSYPSVGIRVRPPKEASSTQPRRSGDGNIVTASSIGLAGAAVPKSSRPSSPPSGLKFQPIPPFSHPPPMTSPVEGIPTQYHSRTPSVSTDMHHLRTDVPSSNHNSFSYPLSNDVPSSQFTGHREQDPNYSPLYDYPGNFSSSSYEPSQAMATVEPYPPHGTTFPGTATRSSIYTEPSPHSQAFTAPPEASSSSRAFYPNSSLEGHYESNTHDPVYSASALGELSMSPVQGSAESHGHSIPSTPIYDGSLPTPHSGLQMAYPTTNQHSHANWSPEPHKDQYWNSVPRY